MTDKIPILKLGDVLIVSLQVDLNDKLALVLQDDLAEMISSTKAKVAFIDISALDIVDSFTGRILSAMARTSYILGAKTVIVGMQPAVAITLVELGLSLQDIVTAITLEKGMEILNVDIKNGIINEDDNSDDIDE